MLEKQFLEARTTLSLLPSRKQVPVSRYFEKSQRTTTIDLHECTQCMAYIG